MSEPPHGGKREDDPFFVGPGIAKPEPAPSPAPAPGLKDKLRETFATHLKKRDFKDELKDVLGSEREAPAPLAKWNKGHFGSAPDTIAGIDDAPVGAEKLLAKMRRRPLLSSALLMAALMVLAVDLLILARHMNLTSWNPIGLSKDKPPVIKASPWDDRNSGLSLLNRGLYGEGEETDPVTGSAITGSNHLAGGLIQPDLPEGLGGIVNPEDKEEKKKLRLVNGVELDAGGFDVSAGAPDGMDRTRIAKGEGDDFTLAGSGGSSNGGHRSGAKAATGVYFGEAGDDLNNYAKMDNGMRNTLKVQGVDDDTEFPTVPEGVHGQDLVQAMIGDDVINELRKYAKEGTWRMKKANGVKQNIPEVSGEGLANSYAASQLLETKRYSDKALKCGTCDNDDRINMNRATFYGEVRQH